MSVRKKTDFRLTLIRVCQTCGKEIITSAASPWMRQLRNVDGKKQKTCYFCSESCKNASYIHKGWYDGKTEQRRADRDAKRDHAARGRRYYAANREKVLQKAKERYWKNPEEYRERCRYNRKKRKLMEEGATA